VQIFLVGMLLFPSAHLKAFPITLSEASVYTEIQIYERLLGGPFCTT
jgi:hypothetical protein